MTRLEVRYETGQTSLIVGELLGAEGTIFFQYGDEFRAKGLELSPFKLPTTLVGPIEERERTYHGLHGLFNDSLPDGWGMMVMDRELRSRGVDLSGVTPLHRLAFLGTRTMGALTYHPATEADDQETREIDLTAVAEQAERVLEGSTEEILPELVKAGGSPMGARPKILAGVRKDFGHLLTGTSAIPDGYTHWLIKFAAKEDPADVGPIEIAYSEMAQIAGVSVPPTHLFATGYGKSHFGVQRFDRDATTPSVRIHTHTFAGLIHHDHRNTGQDYHDLLKVTRALTKNHEEVREAFRRMVFNVLAYNRDDHSKNFAFQMEPSGEWKLAPAYDITFSSGPGGEHTLMVAGEGRSPTRAHVENVGKAASLEPKEIHDVIEAVRHAVAEWETIAKKHGVSRASIRSIQDRMNGVQGAGAFVSEGKPQRSRAAKASAKRKRARS